MAYPRRSTSGGDPSLQNSIADRQREANQAQRANSRILAEAAYKDDVRKAIASGVPESALPKFSPGMDLAAANSRLSYLTGGAGSANVGAGGQSALNRTVQGVANPPPTGNRAPDVVTRQRKLNPKDAINPRATGGESAAQADAIEKKNAAIYRPSDSVVTPAAPKASTLDKAMNVNSPGIQAALNAVPSTKAEMAANPTNYGTGSVRFAKPGEKLAPAKETAEGITRQAPLTWDQQIVKDHPGVGIAGSEENLAFLAAHKAAQAAGNYDPAQQAAAIAEKTLAPIYAARQAPGSSESAQAGNLAKQKQENIAAATAAQQPTKAQRVQAALPPSEPENVGGLAGAWNATKGALSGATEWVGDKLGAAKGALATAVTGSPLPDIAPQQQQQRIASDPMNPANAQKPASPTASTLPGTSPLSTISKVTQSAVPNQSIQQQTTGVPAPQPPVAGPPAPAEDDAERRRKLASRGSAITG